MCASPRTVKGIVGKNYATNNKAITASYLAKSVMGLEILSTSDND
ncbi:MAG: hypothetical protein ACTSPS_20490 [Promethearchaeota archaeon]